MNKITLLTIAIVSLALFVLPNTISMFVGQHTFEAGVQCQKCHVAEYCELPRSSLWAGSNIIHRIQRSKRSMTRNGHGMGNGMVETVRGRTVANINWFLSISTATARSVEQSYATSATTHRSSVSRDMRLPCGYAMMTAVTGTGTTPGRCYRDVCQSCERHVCGDCRIQSQQGECPPVVLSQLVQPIIHIPCRKSVWTFMRQCLWNCTIEGALDLYRLPL